MIIRFAQIEPTTRCNFTCAFCVGRFMAQSDIPVGTFRTALDFCDGLERIELQGEGEPLLHRDFFEMAQMAADKGAMISMITNGSLLNARRVAALVSLPVERIGVSIESPDDQRFAEIRGGRLKKVREGLLRLRKARDASHGHKAAIGLNVTVLKSTLADFEQIVALYKELGLDGGIGLQGLQDMDDYTAVYNPETRAEMLSEDELAAIDVMRQRVADDPTLDLSRQDVGFFASLFREFWDQPTSCPWLDQAVYITTDGAAMPCCHVKDSRWSFGTVGETARETILAKREEMRRSMEAGRPMPPCRKCWVTDAITQNNTALAAGTASPNAQETLL